MESIEPELKNDSNKRLHFHHKTRYVVLILGLLCILFTNADMNIINFTVICMTDVIESQRLPNETHWLENSADVSIVFSTGGIGAILGLIPSVPMITRFGIRTVFSLYGYIGALGTIAIPFLVEFGFTPVLIARLMQGFGASILFSAIGVISEGWCPLSEISTYVAFLSSGFQISYIVLMPASGILCDSSLGWRSIFFIFGGLSLIFVTAFFVFVRDNASSHKHVSHKELRKISTGKNPVSNDRVVPYFAICQDKVVLSIWAAAIGGNMALMCLMAYGPTYLNKVLGLDVRETGYSNAIPYVFAAIVKFIAGPLSDKLTFIPETWRMIFFAAVSQLAMACGFFVMSLTRNRLVAQIAYTVSIVLAGINIVGVVKCAQLRTRQHVHFVMACISLSAWSAIFVLPIITGYACPDHTYEQWSFFYKCVAVFVIIMNIPFPFVATTESGEYTRPEWKLKQLEEKHRKKSSKIAPTNPNVA